MAFGILKGARAIDHLIGEVALLVEGHLRGDAELRVSLRESAILQTFELLLGTAPADNHAIEIPLGAGLQNESRFFERHLRTARAVENFKPVHHNIVNPRVEDPVQALAFFGIGKNNRGQFLAVDGAAGRENFRAEFLQNFFVGVLPGLEQFACERIGVENLIVAVPKKGRYR